MLIEERIKQIIGDQQDRDDYIVGFADLSGFLPKKYQYTNYSVVVGKKLDDRIMDAVEFGPTAEYLDYYHQINRRLSTLIHKISDELKAMNISSVIIEPTVDDDELDEEYYQTLRVDVSHKMAATRAGLGWIGKTALFVSEKFGPRLRLATLLTDYPLRCGRESITESRCGSCQVCVDRCPAQAANGASWQVKMDRDEFFDAFKCREKCRQLSRECLNRQAAVCGICVSVCPLGKQKN